MEDGEQGRGQVRRRRRRREERQHGDDRIRLQADQDEADDELLRCVSDWYYEDEDLEKELQKFAFDHAQEFEDECSTTGGIRLGTRTASGIRCIFERRLEECVERARVVRIKFLSDGTITIKRGAPELYSGPRCPAGHQQYDVLRIVLPWADGRLGTRRLHWGVPLLQDMDTLEFLFEASTSPAF